MGIVIFLVVDANRNLINIVPEVRKDKIDKCLHNADIHYS